MPATTPFSSEEKAGPPLLPGEMAESALDFFLMFFFLMFVLFEGEEA
jgi:hypothetical protein